MSDRSHRASSQPLELLYRAAGTRLRTVALAVAVVYAAAAVVAALAVAAVGVAAAVAYSLQWRCGWPQQWKLQRLLTLHLAMLLLRLSLMPMLYLHLHQLRQLHHSFCFYCLASRAGKFPLSSWSLRVNRLECALRECAASGIAWTACEEDG